MKSQVCVTLCRCTVLTQGYYKSAIRHVYASSRIAGPMQRAAAAQQRWQNRKVSRFGTGEKVGGGQREGELSCCSQPILMLLDLPCKELIYEPFIFNVKMAHVAISLGEASKDGVTGRT